VPSATECQCVRRGRVCYRHALSVRHVLRSAGNWLSLAACVALLLGTGLHLTVAQQGGSDAGVSCTARWHEPCMELSSLQPSSQAAQATCSAAYGAGGSCHLVRSQMSYGPGAQASAASDNIACLLPPGAATWAAKLSTFQRGRALEKRRCAFGLTNTPSLRARRPSCARTSTCLPTRRTAPPTHPCCPLYAAGLLSPTRARGVKGMRCARTCKHTVSRAVVRCPQQSPGAGLGRACDARAECAHTCSARRRRRAGWRCLPARRARAP